LDKRPIRNIIVETIALCLLVISLNNVLEPIRSMPFNYTYVSVRLRDNSKNGEQILGEWNRFSRILVAELKKRAEPIYKKARDKYKPDKIKVLFIAESPPFKKENQKLRYFYFEDVKQHDNLFKSIMVVVFPEEENREKGF